MLWRTCLCLIGMSFAVPAVTHAAIIDVRFGGTIVTQFGTGIAIGAPSSGEFVFDTEANSFVSFNIFGGGSPQPGFLSSTSITPDGLSALYQASVPLSQTSNTFSSLFSLDLEGLNPWPDLDAVALLTNAAALATNLDTDPSSPSPSTFTYRRDAGGIGNRVLIANLTSLEVSVPEPTSLALLLGAGLGLAACRRKGLTDRG